MTLEELFAGRTLGYDTKLTEGGWYWRGEGYDDWDWDGPTKHELQVLADQLIAMFLRAPE